MARLTLVCKPIHRPTSNAAYSANARRAPNPLRLDPSRTTDLRKHFAAALTKRFNRIKFRLIEGIVKEDWLGLRVSTNAFCPTGPGGGRDNSCGGSEGGVAEQEAAIQQMTKSFKKEKQEIGYGENKETRTTLTTKDGKNMGELVDRRVSRHMTGGGGSDRVVIAKVDGQQIGKFKNPADAIRRIARYHVDKSVLGNTGPLMAPLLDVLCGGPGSGIASKVSALADKVPGVAYVKGKMQEGMKAIYARLEARYGSKAATVIMSSGAMGGYGVAGAAFLATGVPGIPIVNDIISITAHTAVAEVAYQMGFIRPNRVPTASIANEITVPTTPLTSQTIALLAHQVRLSLERLLHELAIQAAPHIQAQTEADPTLLTGIKSVIDEFIEVRRHLTDMERHAKRITKSGQAYLRSLDSPTGNTRWATQTYPQKIRLFQEWLRQQIDAELLSDHQLWEAYIQQGFQRGAGRAFDDTRRVRRATEDLAFYRGSRDQFLRSAFAQPVSVERVQILAGRAFTEIEGLTQDMTRQMSRTLVDGLIMGANPRDLGTLLAGRIDVSVSRGITIARTEIIRAHADGQLAGLEALGVQEVGVMVEWSTSGVGTTAEGNPSPCDICAPLEGTVLTLEEAKGMLPRHPNAVFGESTFVPYGECLELVRAKYSGPCIMLCTAGARVYRTTIGPNHPMLTSRGMVKAADLGKGDKILYDLRHDRELSNGPTFAAYLENIPLIQDVFESVLTVGGNSYVTDSGSNLHGDRKFCKGKVEAVTTARSLPLVWDAKGIKELRERFLGGADTESKAVAGGRPGLPGSYGVLLPPTSSVSGQDVWVGADHFVWLQIEEVTTGHYTGLAFDGTTQSSLYCSDGFVVSNCMCAWVPANVGEDKEDQTRGKGPVERALRESVRQGGDDEWGPGADISRSRPNSILSRGSYRPRPLSISWGTLITFANLAANDSYFATCPRDERGRCEGGGGAGPADTKTSERDIQRKEKDIKRLRKDAKELRAGGE